jgi:hypothetical protein
MRSFNDIILIDTECIFPQERNQQVINLRQILGPAKTGSGAYL